MALLTVAQCKDFLRIEHTAEDTMLALWLTMAQAQVEAELGRPITAIAKTWTDDGLTRRAYSVVNRLLVPSQFRPFTVGGLVITDGETATLVAATDYIAPTTGWEGFVLPVAGLSFANGPYTLSASVGLSTAANYSTVIEPTINAALLYLVSSYWHQRNPNATQENTGGGVSTSYNGDAIPARVRQLLSPWRAIRV